MALASSYGTCFGPTGNKGGFSNESVWERFRVDFSSDNTAIGTDLDLFIADHNMVVLDFYALVDTAISSSETTAAVSVGVGSNGTNILNGKLMNEFSAARQIVSHGTGVPEFPVHVSRGSKVTLSKAGAGGAPSAGIFDCYFKVRKRTL